MVKVQVSFEMVRSGLFSNEPFEKKPVMTIEDFVLHSDELFESHLLANALYIHAGP